MEEKKVAPQKAPVGASGILNATLITIGVFTVVIGLYFASIDRPLLTATVGAAGTVAGSLLVVVLSRMQPRPTKEIARRSQRRFAQIAVMIGTLSTVAAGIAWLLSSTTLALLLIGMGPGMIIGGFIVLAALRSGL